jgi:hypothetical protein
LTTDGDVRRPTGGAAFSGAATTETPESSSVSTAVAGLEPSSADRFSALDVVDS